MLDLSETTQDALSVDSVRFIKSEDIPKLARWWEYSHKSTYPAEWLSTTGLMLHNEGQDKAAVFLYETNSKLCMADYLIVNPELTKADRDVAINKAIFAVIALAEQRGFKKIMCNVEIPRLKKRLENQGCVELNTCFMGVDLNGWHS